LTGAPEHFAVYDPRQPAVQPATASTNVTDQEV
jgi:hypothetical protein